MSQLAYTEVQKDSRILRLIGSKKAAQRQELVLLKEQICREATRVHFQNEAGKHYPSCDIKYEDGYWRLGIFWVSHVKTLEGISILEAATTSLGNYYAAILPNGWVYLNRQGICPNNECGANPRLFAEAMAPLRAVENLRHDEKVEILTAVCGLLQKHARS